MFDAILNLEQEYIDDGIAQALIDTVQTSFDEGQDIGFARGLEIGQELAYIQSIAHYLQSKSVTERYGFPLFLLFIIHPYFEYSVFGYMYTYVYVYVCI